MRKVVLVLLAVAVVGPLATSAMAATWFNLGKTSFSLPIAQVQDKNRVKFASIAADGAGNVYASQFGTGGYGGAITIFKTDGSKISINLATQAAAIPGGGTDLNGLSVNKLLRGGDGAIYAVQNYQEIGYSGVNGPNRIVKVGADGSLTRVFNANSIAPPNVVGQITGSTVGSDGNIYWTMNGADGYWKWHYLWRYDVAGGGYEETPVSANNGWSDMDRSFNLVSLGAVAGEQKFAVVDSGNFAWNADYMGWTTSRVGIGGQNTSNPGWGRKRSTGLAYDAARDTLWTATLGDGSGNRNILTRWNGLGEDGIADSQNVWHAQGADSDMGAQWWSAGLAVDAATGDAWMSFGVQSATNNLGGLLGRVVRYDSALGLHDEGTPDATAGANVLALTNFNGGMYALVLNPSGEMSLYSTVPEPGSLLALGTGLIGLLGLVRRRR